MLRGRRDQKSEQADGRGGKRRRGSGRQTLSKCLGARQITCSKTIQIRY